MKKLFARAAASLSGRYRTMSIQMVISLSFTAAAVAGMVLMGLGLVWRYSAGTEQLVLWRQTGDRKAARKARHYYAIILWFIVGAALGALCTDAWGGRALLLTCAPLLAAFGLMFREQEAHAPR